MDVSDKILNMSILKNKNNTFVLINNIDECILYKLKIDINFINIDTYFYHKNFLTNDRILFEDHKNKCIISSYKDFIFILECENLKKPWFII